MTSGQSLETLTARNFRAARGDRFQLTAGSPDGGSGLTLDVGLAEVTEHGDGLSGTLRAPFSVVFHGPLQPILPQGIYRLEHEGLGALDLFIVPIGPDEPATPGERPTAMRYEAVFG
jgi:Domain of unknown function (DUF6916)